MPSLSSGINIALQAVLTHAQAIEVIEHNVANANTPGYRRQSASLVATASSYTGLGFGSGAGQRGSGVTIDRIQRFNLDFFDGRYRTIAGQSKNWDSQSDILVQVESTLAETSDDGLLNKLDQFWSGWQGLASDPTNASLRAAVIDASSDLSSAFNRRAQQLTQIQSDQNQAVQSRVTEINTLGSKVASLNAEISRIQSIGEQPNDLLDQRDLVLDRLAEVAGAVSYPQENGEVIVSIGGHVLVTGHDSLTLRTQANPVNTNVVDVVWSQDSEPLVVRGGELQGILKVRDETIPQQLNGLNQLASKLIDRVNEIHTGGYDLNGNPAGNLFQGSSAMDIRLVDNLQPEDLATSDASGVAGNNTIATMMANLRNEKLMGSTTASEFYNTQITSLATQVQNAKDGSYQNNLVLNALASQRESVAGVSLDEEAANMAQSQRAYQAAARVMTTYDEMLNTIINGMGLVGRS